MSRFMRQVVIVGPEQFEVVEAPRPKLQAQDEIIVRTAACGLCSGDLMPWYLQKKIGTVLGHEVAGWAEEVGAAVTHIRPGNLVFVHHHAPCLCCTECRRGAFVHCATWRQSRLDPGGMAEWIRVPGINVRHDCFAVPEVTVEQALFIEPLGCSVKALGRIPSLSGARGAVVGCGVMGLLNLAAARILGAVYLTAVEPCAERRERARAWGADDALTPEQADAELRQKVDFVVIGPGQPEVVRQALAYVRPAGTALLFTPTPLGATTALDLGDLYFREVSLLPSYSCGPEETRLAYRWLRERRLHPETLVTHRFALQEVQNAYYTARRGGRALKVLVTISPEKSP